MATSTASLAKWQNELISLDSGVKLDVQMRHPTQATNLPTLVLLHFWGGSNTTWASFAESTDPAFPLVIPSLRGWGDSSRECGFENHKISDYAEDICDLLEKLKRRSPNSKFVLAGHSLGGKIVLHCLVTLQDWQGLPAVVLVAPSPACGFDFGEAMLTRMRGAFDDHETACQTIRTAMLGKRAAADEELVSRLGKDALRATKDAVVSFPVYGAQENFEASLKDAVTSRIASGSTMKVLIIEGDERLEDANVKTGDVLRGCGLEVQYERLSCGHLLPVEAPRELASLVGSFAERI